MAEVLPILLTTRLGWKSIGCASTVKTDHVARREERVEIDYAGFVIDDGFLLGYGLNYDEYYRNLPGIYELVED